MASLLAILNYLPIDVSRHGPQVDRLLTIIHWFMGVLFVGWGIFFVYCLLRFRARAGVRAITTPVSAAPSKYAEIAVAIFEVVLLVGFSMPVWAWAKNQPPSRDEAMVVRCVAEQFAWNFHYPGPDGKFGRTAVKFIDPGNPIGLDLDDPLAADDTITVNNLYLPFDKPVIVELSSKDVIHSFWIPVARVKQDVIPGMRIPIWFTPDKAAVDKAMAEGRISAGNKSADGHVEFDISCAQLCGNNHFKMRGRVHLMTNEQFKAWEDAQKKASQPAKAEEDFQS